VVIGNTRDPSYFALARYNADGTPDSTFSEDGKQMTDFGDYAAEEAQSVAYSVMGRLYWPVVHTMATTMILPLPVTMLMAPLTRLFPAMVSKRLILALLIS
jgi:hypothetical protein